MRHILRFLFIIAVLVAVRSIPLQVERLSHTIERALPVSTAGISPGLMHPEV